MGTLPPAQSWVVGTSNPSWLPCCVAVGHLTTGCPLNLASGEYVAYGPIIAKGQLGYANVPAHGLLPDLKSRCLSGWPSPKAGPQTALSHSALAVGGLAFKSAVMRSTPSARPQPVRAQEPR